MKYSQFRVHKWTTEMKNSFCDHSNVLSSLFRKSEPNPSPANVLKHFFFLKHDLMFEAVKLKQKHDKQSVKAILETPKATCDDPSSATEPLDLNLSIFVGSF